ncbi:M20 family metallo-hydrolase [Pseudonocardia asaccharolytica]|uniref:Zn-dependent hydrolase n=1 Tax=Pseudonocardia asaccharolytica DSM 44247 = NBRC 16224 TaxID=1123024 RepID=A0A511CZF4_9PSEU|nr:M20 family metallo-hydrolase [Pseudonocardia asaccharolytica]GEL17930.1 Zn-dependent hydrolase [Pseudonocardia asaccharolytica DSM 44247 = NBRC 16224]
MTTINDIAVSSTEMGDRIERLGVVGRGPGGGLVRFLYDDAWRAATDLVEGWMRHAGLQVRRDAVGNVFGRLPGTTDGERTILTGSHIDTVRSGGKYDGALGIIGGIAALAALKERAGRPRRSLEVVAICEEEGSRVAGNLFGSRGMLGLTSTAETAQLTDADGIAVADMMTRVGLDPARVPTAARRDVDHFVELHVEQGPVLDDTGVQIGVVTGIAGLRHQLLTVCGRPDHAGATPMDRRRDALQGAAAMALMIDDVTRCSGSPAVATIGQLQVLPGSVNTVAERATFSLDLRHPSDPVRHRLLTEIAGHCRIIADRHGLAVEITDRWEEPAAQMDTGLQQLLADTADDSGVSWSSLPSGAAHDSQLWARHVPTSMIFVPSVGGRSHCEAEYTPLEDCVRGATMLARVLYRMAY